MQRNDFQDKPIVNRRKAGLYSAIKYSFVVNNEPDETPTVIDELLDFNRKIVAMEKSSQSSGQISSNDLPRLRGRPKVGLKDEKLNKKSGIKKETAEIKTEITSKQKTGKRSLRSNATPEIANKMARSSSKVSLKAPSKNTSTGKKIFKKAQDSSLTKKGKFHPVEESILRNGKKKRKAQSPIFPEKDTIKKKVKKLIGNVNLLADITPIADISKNEEVDIECSVSDKVKSKRNSVDDVASTHSKSDMEDKDNDNFKGESEVYTKVTNTQMKIKNRKKKSRSMEKTGGNIWAVDSNGSEVAVSDTASNTSRRSSFNSITSDNNSNSQDIKLDQSLNPMGIEKTNQNLNLNSNLVQEERFRNEQTNESLPLVKTQLVVPFSINNKPISKTGTKIKRLKTISDDTDSDTLDVLYTDSPSNVENPVLSNLQVLSKSFEVHSSNEVEDMDQLVTVDKISSSNEKSFEKDIHNTEDHVNNSETTLLKYYAVLESESLEMEKSPIKRCLEIEPKNTVEIDASSFKENDMSEITDKKLNETRNTNISASSLSSPEKGKNTEDIGISNSNTPCKELLESTISDSVPINADPIRIESKNILHEEFGKITNDVKANEHKCFTEINENLNNFEQSNSSNPNGQNLIVSEIVSEEISSAKFISNSQQDEKNSTVDDTEKNVEQKPSTVKETEEIMASTIKGTEDMYKQLPSIIKDTENIVKQSPSTIKDHEEIVSKRPSTINETMNQITSSSNNTEKTVKQLPSQLNTEDFVNLLPSTEKDTEEMIGETTNIIKDVKYNKLLASTSKNIEELLERMPSTIKDTKEIVERLPSTIEDIVEHMQCTIEKTEEIVERMPSTVEDTGEIVEQMLSTFEDAEKKLNQLPITIENDERSVHKKEVTINDTENIANQLSSFVKDTEKCIDLLPSTIKDSENIVEKSPIIIKDAEEMVKQLPSTVGSIEKMVVQMTSTFGNTEETDIQLPSIMKQALENVNLSLGNKDSEEIVDQSTITKSNTEEIIKQLLSTNENTEDGTNQSLIKGNKSFTLKCATSTDVENILALNEDTSLNPITGLLESTCKSPMKKDEFVIDTQVSKEAILNISIDSNIEKLKENFISPELISNKVDENDSLYEDTEMIEPERKEEVGRVRGELPDEETKEIVQNCPPEIPVKSNNSPETLLIENKTTVYSEKPHDQVEIKGDKQNTLLKSSNELQESEEFPCSLIENKNKTNFLKNLKLKSTSPLNHGQDVHTNKISNVCLDVKESCSVKDKLYTGTLKVTLTRKRDCDKNNYDDHKETEALEYKICPKRVSKHNYKNFPLTSMMLLHSDCPQSPPISLYKASNHYKQEYSYRVLTFEGPVPKDEQTSSSCQESSESNNSSVAEIKTDSDSNVKPTRKRIVIPEKSSSFSIHPQRLCEDVCKYCYTKFGSLDTPCHIAQLKSSQLQNHVLKTIVALGTNLTSDSCLCDACYRRVIRMSQEKTTTFPVKKKKKRSKENIPCHVPECKSNGIHNVTKKVFHKIRRALRNKFSIEMERLTSATPLNLCTDHYHWVLVALRCFVCEKRQVKQMSEPRTERVLIKAQLENEGIPVQMVDQSSYICKMCKYFCSLLLKKNHMTPSAKDFFDSYKTILLNKNNSGESSTKEKKSVLNEESNVEPVVEKEKEPLSLEVSQNSSPNTESTKAETIVPESEILSQNPLKLPGEDELVLHTDFDINNPAKSTAVLERFNTTIQFDTETKKLYQRLLRPYGNQSSFLRHLVILEKYFREGNLVLKEGASSKAEKYINTVNNRIQACHGVGYTPVKIESTHLESNTVPAVSIKNGTSASTGNVNTNTTTTTTTSVNQAAITPDVSLLAAAAAYPTNKTQHRKYPVIKPGPPIKLVKNKTNSNNPKPPIPDLNPIERPVEIISSPEISLYNIPAEINGSNPKRLRASPVLEITPDVSISKTYIPKMKSISSSVPISQSNNPSLNTSQSNVVLFFPPSTTGNTPSVSYSQSNTMQSPFDSRRQSFTDAKVSNLYPRVSKVGTSPRFMISQVRSLAPGSMQNTNVNIRPRRNSNEFKFPVGNPPTSGELLLAAFPSLVNNNVTVRGPNQNIANIPTSQSPMPNYMIFPRGPRSASPSVNTSIIPLSGQARSLSGSQVAHRNDKNLISSIRTLLNARPDLQTTFQGNN